MADEQKPATSGKEIFSEFEKCRIQLECRKGAHGSGYQSYDPKPLLRPSGPTNSQ